MRKSDFTEEVLRAFDGRPFGKRELKAANLCNAAPALYSRLAHLVEYLRFHTAEVGDWSKMLPCYEEVIAEVESDLAKVEKDTL